jgi:hypothetical protein
MCHRDDERKHDHPFLTRRHPEIGRCESQQNESHRSEAEQGHLPEGSDFGSPSKKTRQHPRYPSE